MSSRKDLAIDVANQWGTEEAASSYTSSRPTNPTEVIENILTFLKNDVG